MNVEDLYFFLKVAHEGSISKAANSLHITQSALSKCILRLEKELGVTLLERGWEGVRLTEQGSYLLLHASSMIQVLFDIRDTMKSFHNEHNIEPHVASKDEALTIGIDPWLVPVLGSTLTQCLSDNLQIKDFRLLTRSSQTLFQLVEQGAIDIGIGYQPKHIDPNIDSRLIGLDEMVYVYPVNEKIFEPQTTKLPFLLFDNPIYTFFRVFTKKLDHLINLSNYKVIDSVELMFELIASGKAYTITNKSSIHRYLSSDKVVFKKVDESDALPIIMLLADHKRKSSVVERMGESIFTDVKDELKKNKYLLAK